MMTNILSVIPDMIFGSCTHICASIDIWVWCDNIVLSCSIFISFPGNFNFISFIIICCLCFYSFEIFCDVSFEIWSNYNIFSLNVFWLIYQKICHCSIFDRFTNCVHYLQDCTIFYHLKDVHYFPKIITKPVYIKRVGEACR